MDDWPPQDLPALCETSAQALLESAFARRARMERNLSLAIERTADHLPRFDPKHFEALAEALRALATGLDSRSLIALIWAQHRATSPRGWLRQVERLLREERADAAAALELHEALEPVPLKGAIEDVGALAYLMRCVAENRRRHLTWAEEVLASNQRAPTVSIDVLRQQLEPFEAITQSLRILYPAE